MVRNCLKREMYIRRNMISTLGTCGKAGVRCVRWVEQKDRNDKRRSVLL